MATRSELLGGGIIVLTWAVWMFGSAIHYTYLPKCLVRSLSSVVGFAIVQAALTGAVSWAMRRFRRQPKQTHDQEEVAGVAASSFSASTQNRDNILIAGAAFAVAITMTNASVAYGSVSGSRMVKSLEPAIAAGIQFIARMNLNNRADLPWVCLLAIAVCMMLAVAPTGITMLSTAAAVLSTAGISTRNVFVKKHMLMAAKTSATTSTSGSADKAGSGWTADVQTSLNFVACGILIALASGLFALDNTKGGSHATFGRVRTSDLIIASASFAGFQVAALMVLEKVTPTRQAAIKSLQSALTTAWALMIDSKGKRHTSMEIVPALVWGVCVMALTMDAHLGTSAERHSFLLFGQGRGQHVKGDGGVVVANGIFSEKGDCDSLVRDAEGGGSISGPVGPAIGARIAARAWLATYCACIMAILLQCAAMALSASAGSVQGRLQSG